LLTEYKYPHELLSAVYPEQEWLPWKFDWISQTYWEDINNQRKFLEWAGKQLNIKEMSDWYKVKTGVRVIKRLVLIFRI
jgi:hypothetical protein